MTGSELNRAEETQKAWRYEFLLLFIISLCLVMFFNIPTRFKNNNEHSIIRFLRKGKKMSKKLSFVVICTFLCCLMVKQIIFSYPPKLQRLTAAIPLSTFFDSLCCPIALRNYSSVERRCSIRGRYRRTSIRSVISKKAVAQLVDKEFDFAEFGVENAESAKDFAPVLSERTIIWLYDTFAGLPKASLKDPVAAFGRENKFKGNEENAISIWQGLGPWNIITRKGLFNDQLKLENSPNSLGVLHIDGDLYSSINGVLIRVYAKVLNGGVIIIDDWFGGHTGTWESARKAVYDFIIESEIAPKLKTPLGMSAFWFKTKHDICKGCYKSSKAVKWYPLKNQEQMSKFKAKYQEMLTVMDSIVAPECESRFFHNSRAHYTRNLFLKLTANSPRVLRLCTSKNTDSSNLEGFIPDIVYFGTECIDYEFLIERWWRVLPIYGIIVLECWESSVNSHLQGCRPDFYRFVNSNGIMPLLSTIFDDEIAFWIKGPLPVG